MNARFPKVLFALGFVIAVFAYSAYPQSQALDAQIEGFVTDANGASIASAVVDAVNLDTGARRTASTNEAGIFRFPILSLGTYSVAVQHAGFKRSEQTGIRLSAGQTSTISFRLEPGSPSEVVTVTADAAIADLAKFDIGRQVNTRDVKNLPLVSRNPYNFILLQPGTTGRSVANPVTINLSSNGLLRRVGYHLDGSNINKSEVGGFSLIFISEAFVKEVQLLSSGYSAEFGDTAGTVVNFITPSGTNQLNGTVSFLLRPTGLSARPFGFIGSGRNPNLNGHVFVGTVGGPIIKDRWHFYAGYERARNNVPQIITITPANRTALIGAGVPAATLQDPIAADTLPYLIFRTDLKLSRSTRIAFRYNWMDSDLRNALSVGLGSINTTERSFDLLGWNHAIAGQAVTSVSETFFNEFRFQRAERVAGSFANDSTGRGPSINISGAANLGPSPTIGVFGTNQSTMDLRNAVTKVLDRHSLKMGGGINFIRDTTMLANFAQYNFNSVADYRLAASGENRRRYSQYSESFGNPRLPMNAVFANLFIQDEWKLTRRLKVSAGLRYDLYKPPAGEPDSQFPFLRKFKTDTNNFGPRIGLAYLVRDGKYRTVIRGGGGVHYDPPFLSFYRRALQNNGNPRFFTFRVSPNDPQNSCAAPDFPNALASFPPCAIRELPDIDAVSPDFPTMYAIHTNLQVEQALNENTSVTLGYLNSIARHIPVYRNINYLPAGTTLADGRPVYDSLKRVYPAFDLVMMAEADGKLTYQGLFIQLNRRFSGGFQVNASYTFSRAKDDAPENAPGGWSASDPFDRSYDLGPSAGDVRHTFRMSMVASPSIRASNRLANALLNGYQIGLIVFADSGENQNIVTSLDLNRDGVFGGNGPDRPVGIPRNSLRLPAFLGVDMRLSRSINLSDSLSFQVYGEATNVFNGKFVSSYGSTTLNASNVDSVTGSLRGQLPDFRGGPTSWRASRQMQIGLKLSF